MSAERDRILAAIGAPVPGILPPSLPGPFALKQDVWEQFSSQLTLLAGKMSSLEEAKAKAGKDSFVDAAAEEYWGASGAQDPWLVECGVSLASFAIAETGTVVLEAGPGKNRLGSLAPPVNIVLLPPDSLVVTVEEALCRLANRTAVFVTGTSRTADIEGVLVRGVHGPRELWVVRL